MSPRPYRVYVGLTATIRPSSTRAFTDTTLLIPVRPARRTEVVTNTIHVQSLGLNLTHLMLFCFVTGRLYLIHRPCIHAQSTSDPPSLLIEANSLGVRILRNASIANGGRIPSLSLSPPISCLMQPFSRGNHARGIRTLFWLRVRIYRGLSKCRPRGEVHDMVSSSR